MAVNVLVPLLIPLGEQLTNVTKLVGSEPVEFEQPQYVTEVLEDATPGLLLLQLTAKVQPQSEPLEFRIKEGNTEGLFSIDSISGRLTLLQSLDYEEQHQHKLEVEARVGEWRSEAEVLVRVRDVNDHVPTFPRSVHETQITEEDDRHLPKTILTVRATDDDAGEFGHLHYSISGDGIFTNGSMPSFAVNPASGSIDLLRPLDRDPPSGQSRWHLRVVATDGEFEATTAVHINLKDINDNAPYFPQSTVNATISENTPEGASVAQVSALDNDDPEEGQNARLVYSLEKNVIDEDSGRPIFAVDSRKGLITTSLCCLDREKTQRYALQVVATDGGGLKGTGTVLVEVADVNDVPPRFSQPEWSLEVAESQTPDQVLATLTVIDQDTSNSFSFRVVPGSGRGWQIFRVDERTNGTIGGDLRSLIPLDYENPDHRRGFRFRVQVTDMGEEGWQDKYHVDGTWVNLNLVDTNDNPPVYKVDNANLTLPEDTLPGTHLATFTAQDLDGSNEGGVRYTIAPASDPDGRFAVDRLGSVRLVGGLDREAAHAHRVLVWAVDEGTPPRTATATLSVNVTDVNDNPPFLSEPRRVQVVENDPAQVVARVKLGDPDDWQRGHGPPFTIALDPEAPGYITDAVSVLFDRKGDEGRGVGVISTRTPLDREERRALFVPLIVADDGSPPLSATATFTILVADLNDNRMAPATKTIAVHAVQPQTTAVPLGRVYVKDPDDWDAASKIYSWRYQHPNFSLNTTTGDLAMLPGTRDGRYDLGFTVSDATQGQSGVMANVTVEVKSLSQRDVIEATPLTLEADPYHVVKEDQEGGTSILQQLVVAARAWVKGSDAGVKALSVQPLERHVLQPSTRVWLSSPGVPNLHHILLHRKDELGHAVGVGITEVGVGTCTEAAHDLSCAGGCSALASLTGGYAVVDANTSAVVGPLVGLHSGCGCGTRSRADLTTTCSSETCLNGGRCVPTSTGVRCICPHGAQGSRCKVLTRHFEGGKAPKGVSDEEDRVGGWAWVSSIPPCTEVHLSLELLTSSRDALLLYSGPDHLTPSPGVPGDVMALELRGGRPYLLLDLGAGPVTLTLGASYSLADQKWHRLDLIWRDEMVELIVDLCAGGPLDTTPIPTSRAAHNHSDTPMAEPTPHDLQKCRGNRKLPVGPQLFNSPHPLQVGGLAHPAPSHMLYGWPEPLLAKPLKGCLKNLRVNGELIDLGEEVLHQRSSPGCLYIDCNSRGLTCGVHGRCQGSPDSLRCECHPGWADSYCTTPTTPTAFLLNSYVKLALSFTPLAYTTTVQLRFRTWKRRGELVVLSSQHGRDRLALQLIRGQLCLVLRLHPEPQRTLCLTRAQLTDGRWHSVTASRHGSATFLLADDGEGDSYNASVRLEGRQLLQLDKQEGVHVGGSPEYVGISVFKIHGDYHDGCIDDVRISGRRVPLPPSINGTSWGQASMFKGVEAGCHAPPACTNVSCRPPLACVDTWRSYHCGCGEGRVLSTTRTACEDENECVWEPCLNGGTCFNKPSAGYMCACPSGFSGEHCHLVGVGDTSLKLSLGAVVAIIVWCTFLFLLLCAFLLHQHHRRSALRRGMADAKESVLSCKEQAATPCNHTPNLLELKLLKPPKANGQPAWTKNPNIADVDVLQVDAASVTSSVEDPPGAAPFGKANNRNGGNNRGTGGNPHSGDDLRNYAYEGENSSPGSLSSCLESCSGSSKFLGGFREVAHLLESWDPTGSHSNQSAAATKTTNTSSSPATTILCDIHAPIGPDGDPAPPTTYPDPLPPPIKDGIVATILPDALTTPINIPDPPGPFKTT